MVWLYSSSIRDHEVQIFESIIHPTGDYLNTHHVRVRGEPHTTIVHFMDTKALNQNLSDPDPDYPHPHYQKMRNS